MASEQTLPGPGPATTAATAPAAGRGEAAFRWGMTLPTIAALCVVVAFPLLFALYVSLHDYDLTKGGIGPFLGFGNYAATLTNDLFATAARNTVVYSVSVVVLELLVALGLSLLLNQPGLRFRNVYLAILLIPLLVSPARMITIISDVSCQTSTPITVGIALACPPSHSWPGSPTKPSIQLIAPRSG